MDENNPDKSDKPEPASIPLKPIRTEVSPESAERAKEEKEKATPKTLFRKKMGADAAIFVERKRKKVLPPGEKAPSFEQTHEPVADSEPEPESEGSPREEARAIRPPHHGEPTIYSLLKKIGGLLLRDARVFFEKIFHKVKKLPGIKITGIAAAVCLVFGFAAGRCSAPRAAGQPMAAGGPPGPKADKEEEAAAPSQWYPNFVEGMQALKQKNEAQVMAMAEAIANLRQGDTAYPAGWLYMRTKERDLAIAYLEKVPRDSQYASNASVFLGLLALRDPSKVTITPKGKKAEAYFKQALEIDPLNVDARVLYGVFLRKQGRNESAIEQFKAATLLSRSGDTAFVYGIFLKLAENDLNGPPAEPPKNPDAGDNIVASVNLWRSGSKGEALDKLRKALAGLPPGVQRTIVQDIAFKDLPGGESGERGDASPQPSAQPTASDKSSPEKPAAKK